LPAIAVGQPSSEKRRPSSYIAGLDGIRAIACFLVFFAHTSWGRMSTIIPATLGVTIFFFLSGFLITTLLRREYARTHTISLRDFYIRRALRILIPLYLIYAIAVALTHFVIHHDQGTLSGFFSMLFYYFNYGYALGDQGIALNIYAPAGMSVIWSLCIEEHFYFIFPITFLALSRSKLSERTKRNALIAFCVLELLWRCARVVFHFRSTAVWNYYATDARLDSILWGAVLAMFWNPLFGDRTILPRKTTLQPLVFGLAVLCLVASLAIPGNLYRDAIRYTVQALLLVVIFSFLVADTGHWSVRWLENPIMRYLGWISYVLYLSHHMIFFMVENLHPMKPLYEMLLTLALTLAFATLVRYTIELPLQRWRARFRHIPEHDRGAADHHGLIS
jgi:peptidoglycan/LPS O-acetylase OafA/YrhL